MLRPELVHVVFAYRKQWWRLVLIQALILLGLSVVIGVGALLVQGSGASLIEYISAEPEEFDSRAAGVATAVILAIALASVPFLVSGVAATAQITDRALAGGHPRLWRSLGRGFARVVPLLATICLAFLLSFAFLVATPFISVLGVVGLAVTGVIALIRRRRPGTLSKWPGWRTWGFAAIPFAWFGRVTARAVLMLPAAVLEPAGPLEAHRVAERAAAGRRLQILAVMTIAFVAAIALSAGFTLIGGALWGEAGASLLGGVVQLAALPIPIVAAIALYRRSAGPSGRMLQRTVSLAPQPLHSASPVMSRISSVTIVALVTTLGVVGPVFGTANPAAADPANAGENVSYVVTSAGDTLDAAELQAQRDSCAATGPSCTIRAALTLAAEDAADGAASATISFSRSMTIALTGTLEFSANAGAAIIAGALAIDGGPHDVVLDGGGSHQILNVASEQWNLAVSRVAFSHGYSGSFGGALSAGVPETQLNSVLFDGNAASMGAGAVFARALAVRDSTFLDNKATGYSGSTLGGAVRATEHVSVVNSTFSESSIGDQFTTLINNGSDVYADGGMTVVNSTFVNSKGGSLRANTASVIRNSVFTTDWTGGGLACSGSFSGGTNFSREGDSSCPGTTGVQHSGGVLLALDTSGRVPVFPLNPSGNPALGAGLDCPPADALGSTRTASGCDLGAVEFSGLTSLALEAVPSTTVAGTVTLRATATSDTGAMPQGSVTFTLDNVERGTIALQAPEAIAEAVVAGLSMGQTYEYSAVFVPSGPFEPSSAGPLSYTVEPVQVPVDLVCSNPAAPIPGAAPECKGEHWNISDSESIHLVASVVDELTGSMSIKLGSAVIAGPEPVVDGKAAFEILASSFSPGLNENLSAVYESDDATHAGVSVARSLLVLKTPTVSLSGTDTSGIYGDATSGTFTVTVTGAAEPPTGTVTVFGREATLDASGTATVNLSALSVGEPFTLEAAYGGDGTYGRATSNSVTYQTTSAQTTTRIDGVSPVPPRFGEAVTVTVVVSSVAPSGADPQGSVVVVIDGAQTVGPIWPDPYAQDDDGETIIEVVIPADAITGGDHTLTAEFTGNDNFDDSDTPSGTAVSVDRAATATSLTTSPTASVWGDQITLTATVDASTAASVPVGTVAFSTGAETLGTATLAPCDPPNADGCAVASVTIAASTLGIGTSTITAEYQGTTDFAPSTADVENYAVSKATPTVAVTGAATLLYGSATTYTIAVGTALANPADGTEIVITAVSDGSDPISLGTVTLTDGSGTITVPTTSTLLPGTYAITADFAGDASFETASGATELEVSEVSTNIDLDSISSTTVTYGGSLDVQLSVNNVFGDIGPEGDLVVTWMGHEVGRATLGPEHDTGPGTRTVAIATEFGTWIPVPGEFWLTAQFVPAAGFAGSQLSSDAPEERKWVTVEPLQTEISVDMTAVLGLPLEATATVSVTGDDLGITPGGWVDFVITKSGGGFQEVGSVALVDGKATLADALAHDPQIVVDLAGSWRVRANYTKDTDFRYVSESPNHTAVEQVDVGPGGALVTATPPETAQFGVPVVVHVTVAGAVTPTGVVRVYAPGAGNLLVSEEVQLVDGEADIEVHPYAVPIGTHEFVVQYGGNGALNAASSEAFTIVVGKTGTTTTVDSTSRVFELYPGIVGATVQYTAHVTAAVGTATGFVNFKRGSTLIGQSQLDENGNAAVSLTADVEWAGDIVAEFSPDVATVQGSSGVLAHSWVQAPVVVALNGSGSGRIGVTNEYSAYVRFDWTQFQYLATHLRPPHAPSGVATVSAGAGTSCAATLIDISAEQSSMTCSIRFATPGATELTATYSGDGVYAAGESTALTATVFRGVPELKLTTPNGSTWAGLDSILVDWSVRGPSDGAITITRGSEVVCTSTSLVGSCNVSIPAYNDTSQGNRLTLKYDGDASWNGATVDHTGTIVACIPVGPSRSNPAGMATVTVYPEPTCGGGTGYLTTDSVYINATPEPGYMVSGFQRGAFNDPFQWPFARSEVARYPSGDASMNVYPRLLTSDGKQLPFAIQANVQGMCVPVRFKAEGIADRSDAINMLYWETARNECDSRTTIAWDNSVIAYIPSGAEVRVRYQDGLIPAHNKFYGWQGLADGDPFAAYATYTINAETSYITASFGAVCYSNAPRVVQPNDGTITVALPEPNCADPQTGATGWAHGTAGSATLVDAVATTLQEVSRRGAIVNGERQRWDESRWLPERPVYFDGWRGDTGSWSEGKTTTATDDGVRRTSRTITFRLGQRPFTISAAYGGCSALSTQVYGDSSDGAPGTVTMHTAPNCPIADGNGKSRWYRTGTDVSVSTKATGTRLKFMGWSGFAVKSPQKYQERVTFALDSDVTAVASYGINAHCRPLTISSVPAGALTLDTDFFLGENACAVQYGSRFYDQGMYGNGISVDASPATADAEGSQTVFAWSTNEPVLAGGSEPISKIWSRTTAINELLYGASTIVAYACEFVAVGASVRSPNGQLVSSAGAANISQETQSRLGDFVMTQPADCATGSDPKSGYGGYAWTVGTQLMPIVVADPVAYRFTGWSGDVSGTGESPDAPLHLVGAGRASQGDNYNYRVTANFDAICYKLSLPSDSDKLEVTTAPNCPGVAASENRYLGGTPVVIHASDRDDTLFRHWVSGVDAVDGDPHWASVVMTSDKSVVPYYSSKSAGEYVTQYGTLVGESLAVGTKKMVGVASAALAAYVKVLVSKASLVASGIGYIAQGLELMGVHGAAIDGMKNASAAMDDMISLLWAPLDCITAWSAGGENTAFFAAQNLIGTAVVSALSSGAQQQKNAAPESTFAKLKAQAAAAKEKAEPGLRAVSAIAAAKSVYDAASSGNIGWESSAYDAWASQNSVSVFTTCMSNRAGGAMTSVMTALD